MKRDVETLPALIEAVVEATNRANLGLVVTTEDGDEPVAIYANQASLEIAGATEEQILGKPSFLSIAPEEHASLRDRRRRALAGEPLPTPYELTVVRVDTGARVPVEIATSHVMYGGKRAAVTFIRDISERRRTLARLTESETRFRRLIEAAPEAIAVARDGRLVYGNPSLLALLGYTTEELTGTTLRELMHPDDHPRVAARVAAIVGERRPMPPIEYRVQRKGGEYIEVEVSSIALVYDGGPAKLTIGRDVTERNRVRVQLAQTDRLAALGVLAAGVAHEINNPLAYVLLNLTRSLEDLAALGDPRVPPILAYLTETLTGVERVATIARDLGAFARARPEPAVPVDVRRVVESALKMSAHEIDARARLTTSWRGVPPVVANETRLVQVFVNLLVNAAHAIPDGNPDGNRVDVVVARDGDRVVVDISDTGAGIAPDDVARIFDPFFTTKRIGTGLGLSICHSIVTGIGGELTVTSSPGHGSTFRVALRVADGVPERAVPVPRAPAPRRKILVVDDEVSLVTALQSVLSESNDIAVATSGAQALAMIDAEPFDLILCDLMMAPVSGMDVHRELAGRGLADRMVFMTGGTYTAGAREFLRRVPNARIEKPFDVDALDRLIADHLK